jgi:hypothetical protein
MLGEMGVEPHVIEAALNHAAIHSRLAATYNQARYLPAVREALQRLADRLDAIMACGAPAVALQPARVAMAGQGGDGTHLSAPSPRQLGEPPRSSFGGDA